MTLRFVLVVAFCMSSAFAANISKLQRQCEQQNLQACNKLTEIAKSPKERNSDRIDAIGALGDQQLLTDISSSEPNQYVKAAAVRRLKELVNIDFLRAIDEGDVGKIRTLAFKGAEIDPHGAVTDVDQVQAVTGGFQYRFASRRGASSVMVRAIRSGHVESVRALVDLGADVKTEFFNNDMNLGFTSAMSQSTLIDQAPLGLPGGVRDAQGVVFASQNGTAFCRFRPRPATKASYLSLAEQVPASTQILDMLRDLSGAPKNLSGAPKNSAADDFLSSAIDKRAKGDLDGAVADCSKAIQLKPDLANAYLVCGLAKRDKHDPDGAIAAYTTAIQLQPDFAAAYLTRGYAKSDKEDYAGAIADYSSAIQLQPSVPGTYNSRGNAKRLKGDLDGAIADYSKAAELKPDLIDAYTGLAVCYLNRGTEKKAKGDLDGANQDYLKAGAAFNNSGNAKKAKGDLEGANTDFSRARAIASFVPAVPGK